jgi:hypothetical protein
MGPLSAWMAGRAPARGGRAGARRVHAGPPGRAAVLGPPTQEAFNRSRRSWRGRARRARRRGARRTPRWGARRRRAAARCWACGFVGAGEGWAQLSRHARCCGGGGGGFKGPMLGGRGCASHKAARAPRGDMGRAGGCALRAPCAIQGLAGLAGLWGAVQEIDWASIRLGPGRELGSLERRRQGRGEATRQRVARGRWPSAAVQRPRPAGRGGGGGAPGGREGPGRGRPQAHCREGGLPRRPRVRRRGRGSARARAAFNVGLGGAPDALGVSGADRGRVERGG